MPRRRALVARPAARRRYRVAYAGVRPLYDDGAGSASAVTRDYVFDLDEAGAPALSVLAAN